MIPTQPQLPMLRRRKEDKLPQERDLTQYACKTLEQYMQQYPIKCMDDIE
jgi:hypothetical protein